MQILHCNLVSGLERSIRIVEPRDHVKQDNLRVKAPRQPRSLIQSVPGRIRKCFRQRDRDQNPFNVRHYATSFRATNIALERAFRLQGFE